MNTVFRVMAKNHQTGEEINFGAKSSKEEAMNFMEELKAEGYWKSFEFYVVEEEGEMEETEGIECIQCGDIFDEEDIIPTRDGDVCRWCYDEYYYACWSCDEYFHADDLIFSDRGDGQYCRQCFDEHYRTCAFCDAILHRYDAIYIEDTGYVCDYCYDDHFLVCDYCGEIYPIDEVHWNEENEAYYCRECMPQGIRNYSYEPTLVFRKMPYEEKPLFMGVELEVDEGGKSSQNACEILAVANETAEEHIYIKEDGSLNDGFEIVSQPCSFEYHMMVFPWMSILDKAKELGYLSHDTDTCGLHIHIDRNYFGETIDEQETNIAKLVLLVELLRKQMKKIGRREGNSYAKYITDSYTPKDADDLYWRVRYASRYHAVNLQNTHTVELRFFRGTLNYATFKATLQFVKFLVDYAISQPLKRIQDNLTWEEFISAIPTREYYVLVDYLKKLGLWFKEEESEHLV